MRIAGIQKVSLVDYDGHISSTIFTSGCNFACPFCHNSGLVRGTEPIIATADVLEYLEKRKSVLDSVCISGGEPTLQPDLIDFIREIKSMGYLVKLDTNGTNLHILKELVENKLIDYIAMDIKNSWNKYHITTNSSVPDTLKDTIDYIMSCGIDYEFRTTLVQEFHSALDLHEIGQMIKGANKYYLQKFVDNDNCLSTGLSPINNSTAQEFAEIARRYVKNTHLRGY